MLGYTPISTSPISAVSESQVASISINASATVSAGGSVVSTGAVSMSASATLDSSGRTPNTTSLSGSATLTPNAVSEKDVSSAMSGSATTSQVGRMIIRGRCNMGQGAAFDDSFDSSFDTGTGSAGVTMSADATVSTNPLEIESSSSLSGIGNFVISGAVSMTGTATINRAALGTNQNGASLVSGPATLNASLFRSKSFGSAIMTASSSLSGTVRKRVSASVLMSSSATVTAKATSKLNGVSVTSGPATLTTNAVVGVDVLGAAHLGKGGDVLTTPSTVVTSKKTSVSSSTWLTAASVAGTEFVGGEEYLLLCIADIGNQSSTSTRNEFRLIHGSTQFSGSFSIIESNITSQTSDVYAYMVRFTQTATPETISFQLRGSNAIADSINIMAVPLSNLTENSDYYYGENTTQTEHLTSYQDFAQVSFTPANNLDDWLVIANPTVLVDRTDVNYEYRLHHDNSTNHPHFSHEGEDSAEQALPIISRVYQLENSAQTFTVQGLDDAIGANEHSSSRIFALRLNKLRAYAYNYNYGPVVHSAGSFGGLGGVTLDSDTNSKAIILGYAEHDVNGINNRSSARITVDDYVKPEGADGVVNVSRDTSDTRAVVRGTILDVEGATSYDVGFDLNPTNTGSSPIYSFHNSIVAFQLALAGSASEATINANGSVTLGGGAGNSVSMSSSSTVAVTGHNATQQASASVTSTASVSSIGSMVMLGAADITTSGSVVSAGDSTNPISLSASATVGSDARLEARSSAAISSSATTSQKGSVELSGAVGITCSGSVTVKGSLKKRVSSTISASATMSSQASTATISSASLTSSSTLNAESDLGASGRVSLTNTANIAGKGVLSLRGVAGLQSSALLMPDARLKIDARNNDIVDFIAYIDQGRDFTLYIDQQSEISLCVDRELELTLER